MIQELPAGAMLVVVLSEKETSALLGKQLSLSAITGDSLCVVGGPDGAIAELESNLSELSVACRRLRTTHAFHSAMLQPLANQFTQLVQSVRLNAPKIPYISNVTGSWITVEQATSPDYWAAHLCEAVRFSDGVAELGKDQQGVLLEIGPGQSLGPMAIQQEKSAARLYCPTLRYGNDNRPDEDFLLTTLGKLWLAGIKIDWRNFYADERRQRIPLPTYPFERRRYWIGPGPQSSDVASAPKMAGKKTDISEWFYLQSWKRSLPPKLLKHEALAGRRCCWVVLADQSWLSSAIVAWLKQAGQDVIKVMAVE